LLHDLAHVPFGHTLEKEGLVFKEDEWQDPWRYEQVFGESSVFSKSIGEFLLNKYRIPKDLTKQLLDDVASVLVAKSDDVPNLPYPFIHDLVGNTICADLIDYIQRDMYFCGLTESFGKRFLQYLAVMPTAVEDDNCRYAIREGAASSDKKFDGQENTSHRISYRLVLLQYRYNEEHTYVQKHDVIAEGIDLVRRRLAVAEKLYFHRTKVVASSMIVAAAQDAGLQARDIWNMSDSEVLKHLCENGPARARALAEKLQRRHLLKPIFIASFHAEDMSAASEALWNKKTGAYSRFSQPEKRAELIEKLENIIANDLGKRFEDVVGAVSVSCPNRNMNLKAFDMLVLPEPEAPIIRLQDSVHPPTHKEIEAIQETHKDLWELQVFVDPKIVDLNMVNPFATKLAHAIEMEIGVKNEIPKFRNAATNDLNTLRTEGIVSAALSDLGIARESLKVGDLDALTASAQKDGTDFRDVAKQFLIDHGYLK
jgi:HD superfamily phosphohydrolase